MMARSGGYNNTNSGVSNSTAPTGGTGTAPPSNPFLESYRAWAERTPFITRITTILVIVCYILSFFVSLDLYFANIPYFSIQYFEIYRLFLSPLVGNSIIFLIIMLLSFPAIGLKIENSMGSSAFLFLMLTIDVAINLAFVVLCYLAYATGTSDALLWSCADFWTILFALISIDCFFDPETPRRMLCIPYDIPSKYMPLALYALMVLLSGELLIAYGLSILYGYLYTKGFFDKLRPSSQFLQRLEQEGGILHWGSRQPGWVLAGTLGHDAWVAVNANAVREDHSSNNSQAGPTSGFSMFGGNRSGGYQPVPTTNLDDTSSHNPMQQFPGSGHKLANASVVDSTSSSTFGYFSVAPSAPPAVTAAAVPSREEIAARRLAALNASKTSNESNNDKV